MARGVLVVLVAAVCFNSCTDSPPTPSVESFCGGICAGVARCDRNASRSLCASQCVNDPGNRSLASIRPEAAAVVGACLAEEDCPTIFEGPFDDCWDRAHSEISPSPHLLAFCPGYSTSAFECGAWFSVEDCRTILNIWTDEFLDGLAACTREATCEAESVCLENRFGGN